MAYWLFWLGFSSVFLLPIAMASLRTGAERSERLALVVLLGVALYLIKVLGSPDAFTFTDEFVHCETRKTSFRPEVCSPSIRCCRRPPTTRASRLSRPDSPISRVSHRSSQASLIVGGARVLISASLFFVAERVTRSSRAAAGASLIYAANPMFLFWGATFSYENVALPIAAFAVWWLGRTRQQPDRLAQAASAIAIVSVTVTHHVAGFALAALLAAWWFVEGRRSRTSIGL